MSVYLITTPDDNALLQEAIKSLFPDNHLKVSEGQFLASSNLLTEQIKNELGGEKGALGRVLIVKVASYGGWHSKLIWEWLESRTSG